jgi:hypothetical protein
VTLATSTIEHIIPEPLGCPENFVLKDGQICRVCNNQLGHIDQAVIDNYDFMTFFQGIPRKRNRPPIISNRGNVIGRIISGEPFLQINMEKYPISTDDGTQLAPSGKSKRSIKSKFERKGKYAHVNFKISIGDDRKFIRGIYKIAFESLVFFLGANLSLNKSFDAIRDYVLRDIGERKILLLSPEDNSYRHEILPPYSGDVDEYVVGMRLGVINYIVDISPNMRVFTTIRNHLEQTYGKQGWSYLPV